MMTPEHVCPTRGNSSRAFHSTRGVRGRFFKIRAFLRRLRPAELARKCHFFSRTLCVIFSSFYGGSFYEHALPPTLPSTLDTSRARVATRASGTTLAVRPRPDSKALNSLECTKVTPLAPPYNQSIVWKSTRPIASRRSDVR